ncbi:MAG: lactate racemase domain-containing protein [Promethearchaeota archaeon]
MLQNLKPIRENSLIIVNDHDRSTPTTKIVNLLRNAGILTKPTNFIIASGTHKFPESINPIKFTGARDGDKVIIHDCDDEEKLIYLGKTKNGTEVAVNKLLLEAEDIITVNSVEPHYFAGFTGGIKSIIPGLASRKTIEKNHSLAIKPESCILETVNNPLYGDLWEGGNLLKSLQKIQSIQIVNHNEQIFHMSVGTLQNAFSQAKYQSFKIYGTPMNKKVDHIISFVANPLNRTLYQAQKAMENTKNVLKDNGTFTLIAKCDRGIGNPLFFNRMKSLQTPDRILESISYENYKFGDHKAYYWAELTKRARLFYIGDISSSEASDAFMEKITFNQLLAKIEKWIKKKQTILIDEFGGMSIAYLDNLEKK